jgi:hypothetical protein
MMHFMEAAGRVAHLAGWAGRDTVARWHGMRGMGGPPVNDGTPWFFSRILEQSITEDIRGRCARASSISVLIDVAEYRDTRAGRPCHFEFTSP